MVRALLTLGKSFFNAYPELGQDIMNTGVELKKIISDTPLTKDMILKNIENINIYVVAVEKIDRDILDAAKNLKYIIKHGAGLDNIDVGYATRKGIIVSYAPGQNASSVADLTVGLILAASRKIVQANHVVKSGGWELIIGNELDKKTLGIIGLGSIGKKVAIRAKAFGMNIVAYDMFKDEAFVKQMGIEYVDLDRLLAVSDFVSINLSLSENTVNLIRFEKLQRMKTNAFLINTSRGQVVNEEDLIKALKQGVIKGAALDVYNSEPPNYELVSLPNVICTPHIGGSTYECAKKLADITVNNIKKYLNGESLDYVINPEVLKNR
jgi:D-3-phosphoglycerate dehydrogenase